MRGARALRTKLRKQYGSTIGASTLRGIGTLRHVLTPPSGEISMVPYDTYMGIGPSPLVRIVTHRIVWGVE